MKIGFVTNHISFGGTEVAMYDYAHYNETLLGNTSIILTRDLRSTHSEIYAKFESQFPIIYIRNQKDIDNAVVAHAIDVIYVIKSGEIDEYFTNKCKCIVHCVFTTKQPHGNVYCAISPALNTLYGTSVPVLPHMISVDDHDKSFRHELGIDQRATVIGRYGSYDSFDIPFVYDAIIDILNANPSFVFIAMNTKPFATHPRIVYVPRTTDSFVKRKFINTCDVMLHSRKRGETFGLSCGEFAICGKPIVTYGLSRERSHIDTLGDACTLYSNREELFRIFATGMWKKNMYNSGYMKFTPNNVMKVFADLL